jgi:hypothetical protein|nr:MAG TPA: exonuclease VIII [Caudoviricetes sp.]
MTIYNGLFEPKKSAIKDCGAVQLAIAIDAPNKKVAESIMTGKLWESYPANGDNYFKPKLWEHVEGQPLPTVGQFDESFAQQHTFDGEKWVSTAQDSASGSSAGLPADDEVIDLMTVSAEERFAAVLLFSTAAIDGHLYSQVVDYLDNLKNHDGEFEEEERFNFNVLCALQNNFPVQSMHVEGLNNLVQGIFSHFENQTPGKAAISQFVKRWLENPGKRDELAPGVYKNTALSTSTDDNKTPVVISKRGYKHTYATLDQEIATALLPLAPDAPVLSGNLLDAKKMISDDREDFKRWSASLHTTPQILKYDRASIFGVVQNVPAKDTYHFPDSLRRHIDSWLEANGRFEEIETGSVKQPEAIQNTASNVGKKAEVPPPVVTDIQAKQARETLNDMGYGVYASGEDAEPEEKLSVKAEKIAGDAEQLAERIVSDDFQQRAVEIEKFIEQKSDSERDNLDIWRRVMRTDPQYTKPLDIGGFKATTITAEYMFMRATEIFGPAGKGWGYKVMEEKMIPGAPMTEAIYEKDKFVRMTVLRDADGSLVYEQNHSIKIDFWYRTENGISSIEAYGATPYLYKATKRIVSDGEVLKKSLTDAIKKALSMLGFSADVYLGWYDNANYTQENKAEFDLKNASETAEDAARLRQEFDDKLTRNANTLANAVSVNEINKVFAPIARELEVHRKDAESKGDTQRSRHLSSRLRRLTDIKNGRIAELNKSEEKA